MYARLWWKEARQTWPIWAFLALAALGAQWLVVSLELPGVENGSLALVAMTWGGLYAVTVGAAAFAGERENGTMRMLDHLAAGRGSVWGGKASFAAATSAALAALLVGASLLSTRSWDRELFGETPALVLLCWGAVLLEALGWGLFWSARASNALNAAVLSAVSLGLSLATLLIGYDHKATGQVVLDAAPWHLGLALLLTVLSLRALARQTPGTQGGRGRLLFRSPVAWQGRGEAPALVSGGVFPAEPPPRRSPGAAGLRLAWLAARQGGWLWLVLVPVGLYAGLLAAMGGRVAVLTPLLTPFALITGVFAFHAETRDGSRRFLAHHGLGPGSVWFWKTATWLAAFNALWLVWLPLGLAFSPGSVLDPNRTPLATGVAAVLGAFAVGQLCGMLFPRAVTALVVGAVVLAGLAVPVGPLVAVAFIPPGMLLAIPAGVLLVTWGWSGDWLYNRPGAWPWVRLAGWVLGVSSVLFVGHTASRVYSVPDVGPLIAPAARATSLPITNDVNAASLYHDASQQLAFTDRVPPHGAAGFNSPKALPPDAADEWLAVNASTLKTLRAATERAECQFTPVPMNGLFFQDPLPATFELSRLLEVSAARKTDRGDLAGAWADVLAIFRMSRHLASDLAQFNSLRALRVEQRGLVVAMQWAGAPGLKPELIHKALGDFRSLPPRPSTAEVIRAEAQLTERLLDQPAEQLRDLMLTRGQPGVDPLNRFLKAVMAGAACTPWERARARRVARLDYYAAAFSAQFEPWGRDWEVVGWSNRPGGAVAAVVRPVQSVPGVATSVELSEFRGSTPLARFFVANTGGFLEISDRTEVGRRAFLLMLGLRSWALRHGGRFPASLGELTPDDLSGPPRDPYTDLAFGYRPRADRTPAMSPADVLWGLRPGRYGVPRPGQCAVISAGPDRALDRPAPEGQTAPGSQNSDDLVFVFPTAAPSPDKGP
ncbi:MAG: hypothetical protein U0835_02620 [Isosphaeraceae bacterium]